MRDRGVRTAVAGAVAMALVVPGGPAVGRGEGVVGVAGRAAPQAAAVDAGWLQEAYLKAGNTGTDDDFGVAVAIDGDTIVVGAENEDSAASGVNGNGADNGAANSGAAYVFVRDGTGWTQQAYLKASNPEPLDLFGISVAISGDTIVVGAAGEDSGAAGVGGNQSDDSLESAGAAYVFVRTGTTWTQQAYLKASNPGTGDSFGSAVAISGGTIVVGAPWESSAATGVGGSQADDTATAAGAAYVFVRDGTAWSQQAYLKASNTDAQDRFGYSVAIDGETVVAGADQEDSGSSGVNGDGSDDSATDSGAAYVFLRSGATWSQQAYLKASNPDPNDWFGSSVGISGSTVVSGAYGESSAATGVGGDQADDSLTDAGAAYVYVRDGTAWSQQAYLKASNTGDRDEFGISVAIDGDLIAVGAQSESSSAMTVGGDGSDNGALRSGAGYLFARTGSAWGPQAYLKGSYLSAGERLGWSSAVSGAVVVMAAPYDSSSATGVNGDGTLGGAARSGAVYVFGQDTVAPVVGQIRTRPRAPVAGAPIRVRAIVRDAGGVASAQVRVGRRSPVSMAPVGGFGQTTQTVRARIVVPASGSTRVCVRASDRAGNRSAWICARVEVGPAELPSPSPVAPPSPVPTPGLPPDPSPDASAQP